MGGAQLRVGAERGCISLGGWKRVERGRYGDGGLRLPNWLCSCKFDDD